jgi:hypothetical protein
MASPRGKVWNFPPEAYEFYASHPVQWVEDNVFQLALHPENAKRWTMQPEQIQILEAIVTLTRVAVKSGHGIGKTAAIAFLILWFMHTRAPAKVLLTGSKFEQLKMTTWAELGMWFRQAACLHDEFEYTAERYFNKRAPQEYFCQIVTATQGESITGFHGEHILVLVDEASGEQIDKIRDALMGCLTRPDNHILYMGNPTRTQGAFFDAFHTDRNLWTTMTFNAEQSALVPPDKLAYWKSRYNPTSPVYMVRVLGEFPPANPRAIMSWSDCQEAAERDVQPSGPVEVGVDPAFEGDDLATICVRQGYVAFPIITHPKTTPSELNRHVLDAIRDARAKTDYKARIRVKVDCHGGYGSTLVEAMSLNTTDNLEVVPIYSGSASSNKEYKNYGTEMWFNVGSMIKQMKIPQDEFLLEELSSREWKPADLTVVTMEPKVEFKKRLSRSPDRADALILAFADGPRKVFNSTASQSATATGFEIDWTRRHVFDPMYEGVLTVEILHFVAMVMSKDLTMWGLAGIYEFYKDKLWLYAEFQSDVPRPDLVQRWLSKHCKLGVYSDARMPRVIGNEAMFKCSEGSKSMADVLRLEANVNVREPIRYDEFGALGLGSQMFADGEITCHTSLEKARTQINLWSVTKKVDDNEYGFCKGLLLMLSEVRRQRKPEMKGLVVHDYKRVGAPTAAPEKRNPQAWMAR